MIVATRQHPIHAQLRALDGGTIVVLSLDLLQLSGIANLASATIAAFAAALAGMDESKPDSHLIHSVGSAVVCSGVTARATLCAPQTLSLAVALKSYCERQVRSLLIGGGAW